jgi:isopentenyl-diphosphate delta-isomerase
VTTSSRKMDHIRICLERPVETEARPFDDLMLIHKALPEIDEADIDMSCRFLGRRINAPIMIAAMTGGHPDTREINVNLAMAAQEIGVALGLGSQRAALEDSQQVETFSLVRDVAPDVPIVGNIGAAQLRKSGPEVIDRLADMIDADAIAVHLNFLQESIQPEGDRDASGIMEAIKSAAFGKMPIIVKETGAGISSEVASELLKAGIKIIDISGVGGTSWSAVEAIRAEEASDLESLCMGRIFRNWGIPTPVSIVECASAGAEVISSGGIRNGIDAAKSLALGASMAGMALPLLKPATQSPREVEKILKEYLRALRISMFLVGSQDLSQLRSSPVIILGRTREILEQRCFDTKKYSINKEMAR